MTISVAAEPSFDILLNLLQNLLNLQYTHTHIHVEITPLDLYNSLQFLNTPTIYLYTYDG